MIKRLMKTFVFLNLHSASVLLLLNAVLTTEYPTYANPAKIAEQRATLVKVLSLPTPDAILMTFEKLLGSLKV